MSAAANAIETVEVKGPAGRVVINKSDLPQYIEKGFKLVHAAVEKTDEDDKGKGDDKKTETPHKK